MAREDDSAADVLARDLVGVDDDANPLAPYVPRLVVDWVEEDPARRALELPGSLVFVDISGFTKLSERLAVHGRVGAEELSETIGNCFVQLLAIAYAHGGGLLKFGGDALLLLYAGDDHEARACRAAVGMRRALRESGHLVVRGQRVTLRMSVGVHSGLFHFFLVGASHRELIITGPAASATVAMEGAADAGQILVSPQTAAVLRPTTVGVVKGPGRLLAKAPPGAAWSPASLVPVHPELDLRPFVPLAVRDALLAGLEEPEHRKVTIAFLHFDGTDEMIATEGIEETARQLEALVVTVQEIADRNAIAFLATDIDRDGGKIILTAGAPSTSGNDEARMVMAVREVMDAHLALPLRIGVNRGAVFAGDIGPHYRRTFTVMGDAVNLTARLMAKAAPGQILATPDVLERARVGVEVSELEPFMVKGKARPVRAMAVGPVRSEQPRSAETDTALVGRRSECARLRQAADAAVRGEGSVVEIVGVPGAGKSRLLAELRHMTPDMAQLTLTCEPYAVSTPYDVVRPVLRELFGLGGVSERDAARHVRHRVEALAPEQAPWAPLLGAVLDVDMPDTEESAQLEEQFRRPKLADVTVQLLGRMLPGPTVVLVDDAQWMDEASEDLLGRISAAAGDHPWLVCVVHRAEDSPWPAGPDGALRLELAPLTLDETVELVHSLTPHAPLSAHRAATLAERSGGNPLFLRELVATTADSTGDEALPDSIEAVVAARIDKLSPADRNVLRRASVLGRSFERPLLQAVLDAPLAGDVEERLGDFLRCDGRENVSFHHELVRVSAYEGLPFRLRTELHAKVGDRIRMAAGGRPETRAELLSLHYFNAQRYREAWDYSLVAAEQARVVYADVEAAEFYERSLDAGRRLAELTPEDLARVREALGDAHDRAGNYAGAESAYRSARRSAGEDPVVQARLALKLARVMGWLDRYPAALRWISKGLRILEEDPRREAARQRAQLLAWYGRFCQEEGHHARATRWCERAVAEARAAGEKDAMANALKVLDWASMSLGRLDEPSNWTKALALFEELGDLTNQASVHNFLGGFAYFRGEWSEALRQYRRAQGVVRRAGDTVHEAFYTNNIAEIELERGRVEEARALFTEVSRIWRAAGYKSGAGYVACNQGRVSCALGEFDAALGLFEQAARQAEEVGAQAEVLVARAYAAECLLQAGRDDEALALADAALERSRALGGVSAQAALLHRVRGTVLMRQGRLAEAAGTLERSLEAARARDADYDVALTLGALAELDERTGGRGHPRLRRESRVILDRLGVVWTPVLPARAAAADLG